MSQHWLCTTSNGANLTFKGPSVFLHSKLAFSKTRDSISTHLTSGSVTPICTALVNLCENSLKCSLEPYMTQCMIQFFFLVLKSCPTHSRLLYSIGTKCVHCGLTICISITALTKNLILRGFKSFDSTLMFQGFSLLSPIEFTL